jgi:hypothetical protein
MISDPQQNPLRGIFENIVLGCSLWSDDMPSAYSRRDTMLNWRPCRVRGRMSDQGAAKLRYVRALRFQIWTSTTSDIIAVRTLGGGQTTPLHGAMTMSDGGRSAQGDDG